MGAPKPASRSAGSDIVHEMRNQLAVARANVEAFIDGKIRPTTERLESVLQSLSQLESLVDDLRSTAPQRRAPVRPARINACMLLQREFQAMEALAQAKDIALRVTRCAAVAPACEHFFGDPVRIGQIVKNLALNAVRYTPAGGSISIDCSRRAGQLQVTVSDSGPGVKPAEAAEIFKPRVRGAAAAGSQGSGHGLAIVKEFVERQGGTVEVASLSPSGASFCLRLPGEIVGADAEVCRVAVQH